MSTTIETYAEYARRQWPDGRPVDKIATIAKRDGEILCLSNKRDAYKFELGDFVYVDGERALVRAIDYARDYLYTTGEWPADFVEGAQISVEDPLAEQVTDA